MNHRLILLNLVLLIGCFYLARQIQQDFLTFRSEHNSGSIGTAEAKSEEKMRTFSTLASIPLAAAAYEHLSSRNLFLENRNLSSQKESPVVEQVPQLNPKPVLIGVAKIGSQTRAVIRRPQSAQGKSVIQSLLMGDLYEGYKVTNISEKRVELTFTSASGQSVNQYLNLADPANRQAAASPIALTPVAAAQVIQVGGGSSSSVNNAGISSVPAAQPGTVNPAAAPNVAKAPAGAPGSASGQAAGSFSAASDANRTSQPLRRNEFIDAQGRRVVRTPWGDVVRPPDSSTNPNQ